MIDMSSTVGAMNPDIEAFKSKGGKLIVLHGLADQVISPNPTIAYYKAQVAKSGQAAVDNFCALIPFQVLATDMVFLTLLGML
jgi:feruloyl esterase